MIGGGQNKLIKYILQEYNQRTKYNFSKDVVKFMTIEICLKCQCFTFCLQD